MLHASARQTLRSVFALSSRRTVGIVCRLCMSESYRATSLSDLLAHCLKGITCERNS